MDHADRPLLQLRRAPLRGRLLLHDSILTSKVWNLRDSQADSQVMDSMAVYTCWSQNGSPSSRSPGKSIGPLVKCEHWFRLSKRIEMERALRTSRAPRRIQNA
jgi:hypothetical protein